MNLNDECALAGFYSYNERILRITLRHIVAHGGNTALEKRQLIATNIKMLYA